MKRHQEISAFKWILSLVLLLLFSANLFAIQRSGEVGNPIKKESITDPDGYRGWRYKWTQGGMLKKVIRPDRKHVGFTYDALGRRLTKTYQDQTTHFVWDGNVPLHEWTSSIEASNSVINDKGEKEYKTPENLTTWIFEDGTFIPMAKLKGEKAYSIITDHLGTPIESYDEEGKKVWSRELGIYGQTRKESGEENFIPFLYQGQYLDTETELAYNRFRYYSPESGTYVSQDPVRLFGGFAMYSYIVDSCVLIDPFGLAARYCHGSKRWRDSETGQFRSKPTDMSELVDNNGKIDYPSLMEFKNGMTDWNPSNPHNKWSPSTKFPSGGFKHDMTDGSSRFKLHGHGPNPDAPVGSNAIGNPTTTISRTGGDKLTTNGTWVPGSTANPNEVHIPLTNSPF